MLAVGLVLAALTGCDDDDGGERRAEPVVQEPDQQAEQSQDAAGGRPVRLLRVGRFDAPTYVAAPRGDRRRFVVQRGGTIVIVRGRGQEPLTFLDISDRINSEGEGGLLSMAFAPDYRRSGAFYVYYTDPEGFIQIDRFQRAAGDPNRADPASRRSVIRVPHFRSNHKGGQIQIGPDGMLYAGFGDGGAGGDPDENAQNRGELLGKLIRIDPRPGGGYDVPRSNPFVGGGARPEIYAYGLRNPYRFSFDRSRGHLTVGDVGQDAVEEIDFVPGRPGGRAPRGGYNFGWDVFEGRDRYEDGNAPGHVPPAIAHSQDGGWCSIIGGYVIRDRSLRGTRFFGRYIYGDLCNPELRLAFLKRPRAPTKPAGMRVGNLVSFGEDGLGRVYAVSIDGAIYRIGRG
jgi:glucose/arabinose dehydrogenase